MRRRLLLFLTTILILCMAFVVGCAPIDSLKESSVGKFFDSTTGIFKGMSGCNGCSKEWGIPDLPDEEPEVMKLSTGVKTLIIGESFTIKVTGVGDATVTFSSDNENVATVDQTGLVTSVGIGEATIRVSAAGQSKNCYVTVIEDTRIPTLRFNNVDSEDGKYVLPLLQGESYALDYDIIFGGMFVEGSVQFESVDENVATVDANGVVTAGSVIGNGVETVIKVSAQYNGKYSEDLYTEITVVITDAKWSFDLDSEDAIYAIDTFNEVSYKNTVGYTAALTISSGAVDAEDIVVTCEDGHFEINAGVITAKKAGVGYVKLSYDNGENVYERYAPINVERVVDDRTEEDVQTFVRYEDVASISSFDAYADDKATERVFIYGDSFKTELTVSNGKFLGVDNGINYVEIQNDVFSVKLRIHFTDYYFGEIDSLLYQYTLDENGDGDVDNQSIVLPESFAEESVRYFAIYREDGASQKFAIDGYDASTRTLAIGKTWWNDAYWFWYTGDVYFVIVTDSAYYMGEITVKKATREPNIDVSSMTYYAGELYNGEVAYIERYSGAAEEQIFTLPESFGNVTNFKIAGFVDTVYNAEDRTITVNKSDIQTINNGVKIATFENENGKGYCNLTVAEYVIRSDEEVFKLQDTNENYYIVIANDIDASASTTFQPNTWRTYYSGTIDGKGNIVSNLSLYNTWWGLIYYNFSGTIKNIAFVNMKNSSGALRGLISHQANGAVLDNVYISGTAYREHLFETVQDDGVTLKNTILNFEDGWGEKGIVSKNVDGLSTGEITYGEHFYNIYKDDSFFDNAGLKFGDFEVENGMLFFNGKLLALPGNVDLTDELIDGSLGIVGQVANRDEQVLKLPYEIPGIENVTSVQIDIWDNGSKYLNLAVTYDAQKNAFITTKSAVESVLTGAYSGDVTLPCKIVTAYSTYYAKVELTGYNRTLYFISTAEELETYLVDGTFVSNTVFVLENDIDGAVVNNKTNPAGGVAPKFDGRGYALTNLTLTGYGLLGNYFGGTFKNTIVKISSVQIPDIKGLISGQSADATFQNIYVEADVTGTNVESVFRGVYGGCTFKDIVVNVKGITDVVSTSSTITEENVVTVTDTFFTDNATLSFGLFAMTDAGLTFNGKLVLAKA